MKWCQHLGRLLPILGVYATLGFYGLDQQSLWEDEFLSVKRVASTIPIWKDGHGFLYFALLRGWMQLGTSEVALRSLSVLLGAVAVCLFYAIASMLYTRRVVLMATVLFATSPFLIWYSQEVRYITLVFVTTLLSMCALVQVVWRDRLGWWLVYGSATLLAFFSFLATLWLPVIHGVYLLGSPSRRTLLRKWVVCQALVLALFGWWFANGTHYWQAFVEARDSGQAAVLAPKGIPTGDFNNVTPMVLPYTFFALSTGLSLGPSPRELHADRSLAPLLPHVPMLCILGALYGGLFLAGLRALLPQRATGIFLTVWIAVPILGTFGISALVDLFYDVRYVAMVLPAYVLILAAGLSRCRRPMVQRTLLGAVLVVHGLALANYYFNPRYAREDARSAAHYLASEAVPRDVIVVVGTLSALPYYYQGNPPMQRLGDIATATQPLPERLQKLSKGRDRLWLVQIRPWQTDPTGEVKAALDEAYARVEHQHFPGVDIYAYQVSH